MGGVPATRLHKSWVSLPQVELKDRLGYGKALVPGRVGQACRDAVLEAAGLSFELSCAGRTVGVTFGVEAFVASVALLAW